MRASIFLFWGLSLFYNSYLKAQVPQVPFEMKLGDQKLMISSKAREMIQKDVNALHSNQTYFEKKAGIAAKYFPIVIEVLRTEGIPEDFKYLAIQESGYIADAVSSSNAVGFWQFKKETAIEFGLKVDPAVDERMHIVYSTKAAARYLKKAYFFLQNWALACQSYQMGLGGTQRSAAKDLFGADEMKINKDTYWYIMKFLAHVVAFKPYLKKKSSHSEKLWIYKAYPHEEIENVLINNSLGREEFLSHNRWLLKGSKNPFYKPYLMVVPQKEKALVKKEPREVVTINTDFIKPQEFKNLKSDLSYDPNTRILFIINKKKAILSEEGDSKITLAIRGGISKANLMAFNDLNNRDQILSNRAYYLEKKRSKSAVAYHVYKEGESLWEISQTYAIRLESLKKKNHLQESDSPLTGQVLWLKKTRPKGAILEVLETSSPEIEPDKPGIEKSPLVQDSILFTRDSIEHQASDPIRIPLETADEKKIELKEEQKFQVHTVSQGETLYSISKKYNCTVEHIMEANKLESPGIGIGQTLRIPVSIER
jgi:peptidoglycan lytic transglycosylase D